MKVKTDDIFWLGHSSLRLGGSLNIYFDPWEIDGPPADLILVTHDHFDHLDLPTIKKILGPKTMIAADVDSAAKLRAEVPGSQVTAMDPGDEIEYRGVNIKAVPAYNTNKDFHPKSKNNLGYIVSVEGRSVYHAGDTDLIPEMKDFRADVALLPVSGTYTMTAEEAVEAALLIKPEVAVPMHYDKIVGDLAMAEKFAEALKGRVAVEIKPISK